MGHGSHIKIIIIRIQMNSSHIFSNNNGPATGKSGKFGPMAIWWAGKFFWFRKMKLNLSSIIIYPMDFCDVSKMLMDYGLNTFESHNSNGDD